MCGGISVSDGLFQPHGADHASRLSVAAVGEESVAFENGAVRAAVDLRHAFAAQGESGEGVDPLSIFKNPKGILTTTILEKTSRIICSRRRTALRIFIGKTKNRLGKFLTRNYGPENVTVPDVNGKSEEEAKKALEDLKLKVEVNKRL